MPKPSLQEVFATLRESFWALMLPVLIFGGIYSGYFTANEAAVVACFYAFIVEIFIHRDLKLRELSGVVISSAITSSTLLVIVAGASVFGEYLTFEQIPGQIANARGREHSVPLGFSPLCQYPAADYRHVHGYYFRHPDSDPDLSPPAEPLSVSTPCISVC